MFLLYQFMLEMNPKHRQILISIGDDLSKSEMQFQIMS